RVSAQRGDARPAFGFYAKLDRTAQPDGAVQPAAFDGAAALAVAADVPRPNWYRRPSADTGVSRDHARLHPDQRDTYGNRASKRWPYLLQTGQDHRPRSQKT